MLKKIYKRDASFRAVFEVKTLAVLFSAYPREMKHIPRNLNLPPFWRCLFLWKWCNPFPRARARLKHAHSFDRCGGFSPDLGGKNGGVLSMRIQVILDSSFARPGSAPIWGGKKGEFRDWTSEIPDSILAPDMQCCRVFVVSFYKFHLSLRLRQKSNYT